MRISAILLLAALGIAAAFGGGRPAYARTPTQTPTATPTAIATPTPSPQQMARFHGEPWVDARVSRADITAKIGNVVCGTGGPIPIADVPLAYQVSVVSDQIKPGCGREGAVVTFSIGDRRASQTAVWHAGADTHLNLVAGPPFSLISGGTSLKCIETERLAPQLVPFIDGTACGQEKPSDVLSAPCSGQLVGYTAVVYSGEQQPGCGTEGAEITFKLLDTAGKVIAVAEEKGTWHAWDGVSAPQQVNLTIVPVGKISLGNTGTGDGPQRGADAWGTVAAALSVVGLGGIAAAAALRKRTTTR